MGSEFPLSPPTTAPPHECVMRALRVLRPAGNMGQIIPSFSTRTCSSFLRRGLVQSAQGTFSSHACAGGDRFRITFIACLSAVLEGLSSNMHITGEEAEVAGSLLCPCMLLNSCADAAHALAACVVKVFTARQIHL